jgi:hypothetical protein
VQIWSMISSIVFISRGSSMSLFRFVLFYLCLFLIYFVRICLCLLCRFVYVCLFGFAGYLFCVYLDLIFYFSVWHFDTLFVFTLKHSAKSIYSIAICSFIQLFYLFIYLFTSFIVQFEWILFIYHYFFCYFGFDIFFHLKTFNKLPRFIYSIAMYFWFSIMLNPRNLKRK